MSLPDGFEDSQEYFDKCLDFLERFSWIYETSNTCFIRDNVLEKFPIEWTEYFSTISNADLNIFPDRQLKYCHSGLDEFIQELSSLIPNPDQLTLPNIKINLKKMSPKKQHEISRLSCLIKNVCADDIDILIDFGSGLGYLSELLYTEKDFKIIGIESDPERVKKSLERRAKTYPASKSDVLFKEHFITEDSKGFILDEIKALSPELEDPRLAIIGLHSCADLTVNSMKLFFAMENVQKLIIMPCCYHKLETKNEFNKISFKNFPLSKALKQSEAKNRSFGGFNRPFLRLACQQTSARWKKLTEREHHEHGVDMFFRGVAEAILNDDEMVVKLKGKKTYGQLDFSVLTSIYDLRSKNSLDRLDWTEYHFNRFKAIMDKYPNGPQLAEGLTCLQTSMQELCENIVLYDRLCYMEEQANETHIKISVKFQKLLDELLSPRCYVLIAQKL